MPNGSDAAAVDATALRRSWRRVTAPHASVQIMADQRRVRLAAGLFLILMPVAVLYVIVYELPTRGLSEDAWRSLGVFVTTVASYALVRGRFWRWGIRLAVVMILLAIWAPVFRPDHDAALLYFTVVPVLLGGLLMSLPSAAIVATANLLAAASVPYLTGEGLTGWTTDHRDGFLFLLAVTPLVLLGTGFMDRSVRDVDAANDKLRKADEFRLQVLNTVAHDLTSPLTPIVLRLHMLAKQDGAAKHVDVVQRNINVLQRLINDIKDLAKVEAGRLDLRREDIDLTELADRTVSGFQADAEVRGVRLTMDAPENLRVEADADRLMQVFYNLITNGLKFTPKGGTVRVEVTADDGTARVQVVDSGRGLTADEITHLWKPFSQVHDRAEIPERGTGLGLFITKGIVAAHGGDVWVASDGHGTGSTFGFALPAGQPVPT